LYHILHCDLQSYNFFFLMTPPPPRSTLFPYTTLFRSGVAKRWQQARAGMVVAECGTGKTLISLGAIHVNSDGNPFTALAMVPPRSEEHTSELQSRGHLVCRLLLEKKKKTNTTNIESTI